MSLVALTFAIVWGLGEQHRANMVEQRHERRTISDVAAIIEHTSNMLQNWQQQPGASFAVVCERLRLTADALSGLAGANAMLATAAVRAAAHFRIASNTASQTSLSQTAPNVIKEVTTVRAEIERLMEDWDKAHLSFRERICLRLGKRKKSGPKLTIASHP